MDEKTASTLTYPCGCQNFFNRNLNIIECSPCLKHAIGRLLNVVDCDIDAWITEVALSSAGTPPTGHFRISLRL